MKSNRILLLLTMIFTVAAGSWIVSCVHEADISEFPEICFEGDVLPVFRNSCAIAGCHDGSGESDLRLDNYLDISHSVTPYDAANSESYRAITSTWGENQMPPGQPLSIDNRTLIRLWIDQGARNTVCPDNGGNDPTVPIVKRACFSRDILPVLVSRCASTGCHDDITHKEGYIFTSYTTTMKAVKPGDLDDSKLWEAIKLETGDDKMPPAGKPQLTAAEIDSIGKWIGYGALNEVCGEVCDTANAISYSAVIWPIIQSSCTGCHSGTTPSGNVPLTSYSNVAAIAANGLLVKVVNGSGAPKMPPSGALSECKIRQIELWVAAGYKNN